MRRFLLVTALAVTACVGSTNEVEVSASDFGNDWPLTVVQGTLQCEPPGSVVFTTPEGTSYAVNGTAKDATDLPEIDAIWAEGEVEGLKRNLGPLIQRGLALCE